MKTINKESKFSTYLELYLERERDFVKESSYAIYSAFTYNKVIPYFRNIKLKDLDLDKVQSFCNYLLTNGNDRTREGLS